MLATCSAILWLGVWASPQKAYRGSLFSVCLIIASPCSKHTKWYVLGSGDTASQISGGAFVFVVHNVCQCGFVGGLDMVGGSVQMQLLDSNINIMVCP